MKLYSKEVFLTIIWILQAFGAVDGFPIRQRRQYGVYCPWGCQEQQLTSPVSIQQRLFPNSYIYTIGDNNGNKNLGNEVLIPPAKGWTTFKGGGELNTTTNTYNQSGNSAPTESATVGSNTLIQTTGTFQNTVAEPLTEQNFDSSIVETPYINPEKYPVKDSSGTESVKHRGLMYNSEPESDKSIMPNITCSDGKCTMLEVTSSTESLPQEDPQNSDTEIFHTTKTDVNKEENGSLNSIETYFNTSNRILTSQTADDAIQTQIYITAGVLGGVCLLLTILSIVLLVAVNNLRSDVDRLKYPASVLDGKEGAFGSRQTLPGEELGKRFQQYDGNESTRYGEVNLPRAREDPVVYGRPPVNEQRRDPYNRY